MFVSFFNIKAKNIEKYLQLLLFLCIYDCYGYRSECVTALSTLAKSDMEMFKDKILPQIIDKLKTSKFYMLCW